MKKKQPNFWATTPLGYLAGMLPSLYDVKASFPSYNRILCRISPRANAGAASSHGVPRSVFILPSFLSQLTEGVI